MCIIHDTTTNVFYTLSLHDALPIFGLHIQGGELMVAGAIPRPTFGIDAAGKAIIGAPVVTVNRSEEHTSELQSRPHLVCRLLLEKKNRNHITAYTQTASIPLSLYAT